MEASYMYKWDFFNEMLDFVWICFISLSLSLLYFQMVLLFVYWYQFKVLSHFVLVKNEFLQVTPCLHTMLIFFFF